MELELDHAQLKAQIQKMQSEHATQISNLQSQIDVIRSEADTLRTSLTECNKLRGESLKEIHRLTQLKTS